MAFAELYVPLEGIIDIDKEISRLEKELGLADVEIEKAQADSEEKYFRNWMAIRRQAKAQDSKPDAPKSP